MTSDKSDTTVKVPKKATERMAQAAFEAAGSPSYWFGFDEMWEAAISAWEKEAKEQAL